MLLFIVMGCLWSYTDILVTATACDITLVYGYQYDCALSGWVRNPDTLQTLNGMSTVESCASRCLSQSACKSFRYIEKTSECITYAKHLESMSFDRSDYLSGLLYDRACYSNNCGTIDACSASKKCHQSLTSYYGPDYEQYACAYGKTAKPFHFPSQTVLINGSYDACKAIQSCAGQGNDGSFDVHYHIPSMNWVCSTYADEYDFRDVNMADQRVSPTTYTVLNDTVGAGYGFWMDYIYYD